MVRRKQQAAEAAEEVETQAAESGAQTAGPEAGPPATQPPEGAAQTPPTGAEPPPATQAQPEAVKKPYKAVRSWTERYVEPLRYEKLTDDRLRKLIFRFKLPEGHDKPPAEALEVMRSHKQTPEGQPTGLKFEDTRMHGKVWTIPNDAEGRELADRIDFELSKLAKKMEAAQPTPG